MIGFGSLASFSSILHIVLVIALWQQAALRGVLHGHITQDGRPVVGATVSLYRLNKQASDYTENIVSKTDDAGAYELRLGVGSYVLLVSNGARRLYQGEVAIVEQDNVKDIALRSEPSIVHSPLFRGIMPGALAYLPSGMIVLDGANNRLLQIGRAGNITQFADLTTYASWLLQDMAATRLPSGANDVCLIIERRPHGAGAGLLVQYVNGTQMPTTWNPVGAPASAHPQFSGIAVDNQRQIFYVAQLVQNTLTLCELQLPEGANAHLREVGHWFSPNQARSIGPIAVDAAHEVLFAADGERGGLYRLDLTHALDLHPLTLRDAHGHQRDSLPHTAPSAIALDASGETLYVVGGARLWAVHLGVGPVLFEERSNGFGDLHAVAVDGTGNVWVGDQHRHAVYMLSPPGSVLTTYEN